ncbi:hypothetical protein C491_01042 [Natronococcus amylolyticus DSM 10524]|uniref:Uncharacterized protein n=2 Tax=Natronococcus amylolyticus TaxID=44470 RepID=L9XI58_9EURY|nr:hypothetical protein C491_01042 [Natronococcus amylolyticus DSM 10524]
MAGTQTDRYGPELAGHTIKDADGGVRTMDESTDFEELASRVRTQSEDAAGSDTDRVTIRSFQELSPDALSELLEAAEPNAADPGSLVFVLSRANADLLFEREHDLGGIDDLETELGREIRVEGSMPDDTILLLDPDAVDGEELLEPESIACGIVGSDH